MNIQDIQSEPLIDVGIMSLEKLDFILHSSFKITGYQTDKTIVYEKAIIPEGSYSCCCEGGMIRFRDELFASLIFEPDSTESSFCLCDVRIGIAFHWERELNQCFEGALLLKTEKEHLLAINRIALEPYLYSVIASEMNAQASPEFLKAHAVISRSWLLAQLGSNTQAEARTGTKAETAAGAKKSKTTVAKNKSEAAGWENETERIRWYEREAHTRFDVCADDHCQRYQGILEADTPQVKEALRQTRGLVLCSGEQICDARFSKCCGGITEAFESCWADTPLPYLVSKPDFISDSVQSFPLNKEAEFRRFILGNPPSFCNTNNQAILKQVLKDYDLETRNFFRWEVRYTVEELSDLFYKRSGLDLGLLSDLEAVERGGSGRLIRLRVSGSKGSIVLGKELEIRRCLSATHLYSSAFVVDKTKDKDGKTLEFVLYGAGWGHGVGLCQIGAAVMAEQGYNYKQILEHYYPKTQINNIYAY